MSSRPVSYRVKLGSVVGWLSIALAGCDTMPVGPSVLSQTAGTGTGIGLSAPLPQPAGPTAAGLEQLMLERINRARLHPEAEAALNSITVDEGIDGYYDGHTRPPVAFSSTLAQAARIHADDMLDNNYFAHDDFSGNSPSERIGAVGYAYSATGENLAWNGTTGILSEAPSIERMHVELFADLTVPGRGHRLVMLHDYFREVGISIRRGAFKQNNVTYDALMAVQEYGTRAGAAKFFILGVIYDDRNNNRQYDANEGTPSAVVTVDGASVVTNAGGGYTVEVSPGKHTIVFSTNLTRQVSIVDKNVKVDLVGGVRIDVNLGLGEF